MSPADFLSRIVAHTRRRIEERRKLDLPKRPAAVGPPAPGRFRQALTRATPGSPVRFLCEIKRASPSRGMLRADFDPEDLARDYAQGGADALSVLTEPEFFQGAPEYLSRARLASGLPTLLKDFVLDPWQVDEAVGIGADAVLLIVALHSDRDLSRLVSTVREAGLDPLVEVHAEDEVERALGAGADLVGINHRDLRTFEVDPDATQRLLARIPAGVTVVSESGISSGEQVARLARLGVHAVLIGEHFMRAEHPGAALAELRAQAGIPPDPPRVKICGLTRTSDVREAISAGADFLGVVLCDGPRRRNWTEAAALVTEARRVAPEIPVFAVTRDPSDDDVHKALEAGFRGLQLHGGESAARVAELAAAHPSLIVWKALAVRGQDLPRVEEYRAADAILLDSWSSAGGGGSGLPLAAPLDRVAPLSAQVSIVLAGGLRVETVADAVRRARPFAVDVSSGVEASPGVKDPALVRSFILNAKSALAAVPRP